MTHTLTRTPEGKYRISYPENPSDIVDFDTAQEAIDFWDWCHPGEPLAIEIDHRVHRGYFG